MPHEELKNEVLQKIGRNLLNFQRLEHALKLIIPMITIEGTISKIETTQAANKNKPDKRMAGELIESYLSMFEAPDQSEVCEDDNAQEAWLSFKIRFPNSTPEFRKEKRTQIETLIKERNNFVHHLLPRINFESIDNLAQIIQELDDQREKIIREMDFILSIYRSTLDQKAQLKEFLESDAGKNFFDLLTQEDRLITILVDLLNESKRTDGGCTVSQAGIVIAKEIPHLVTPLKQLYKCKTLAQLISVIDKFEIYEEVTKKGIRTLFKAKHG